jgi:uncharacterized protein YyaL (SSP411 family)
VYTEAWLLTREPLYRRIAGETLDFLRAEMTDSNGGLHASLDADSEGGEGRFYLWTREEIHGVLGADDAAMAGAYFGVSKEGNFEGRNILHVTANDDVFARQCERTEEDLRLRLRSIRDRLLRARNARPRPTKDEKIITAWNGLAISAFARAYQAFGRPEDFQSAIQAGTFFRRAFARLGHLPHVFYGEQESTISGFLDDHAALARAMLDLYETTFDPSWLDTADALLRRLTDEFLDPRSGAAFFTGTAHADAPARPLNSADGSTPAGAALAADSFLRAAALMDRPEYATAADRLFVSAAPSIAAAPSAFSWTLCALLRARHGMEVAIVGPCDAPETAALLRAARALYRPAKSVAYLDPRDASAARTRAVLPLLRGKDLCGDKPTAYVCRAGTCEKPVTEPSQLATLLAFIS